MLDYSPETLDRLETEAKAKKAEVQRTIEKYGKPLLDNQAEILTRMAALLSEYGIHVRSAMLENNIHFAFPQFAIRFTCQIDGTELEPFSVYGPNYDNH